MITLISFAMLIVLTSSVFGLCFFATVKQNSSLKYACLSKSFSDKTLNLLNIKDGCIVTCFNCYFGFIFCITFSAIRMSNIEDALKNNTQPHYKDIFYIYDIIWVSIFLALAFIMLLAITIVILYSNSKQNKKINNIKIDSSYLNELILYVKNIKIYSDVNNRFLIYSINNFLNYNTNHFLYHYTNKINKIVSKIQNSKDKVNLNFLKLIKAIIYITHNSNFYAANYYCGSTVIDRKELIHVLNEKIDKCILN